MTLLIYSASSFGLLTETQRPSQYCSSNAEDNILQRTAASSPVSYHGSPSTKEAHEDDETSSEEEQDAEYVQNEADADDEADVQDDSAYYAASAQRHVHCLPHNMGNKDTDESHSNKAQINSGKDTTNIVTKGKLMYEYPQCFETAR